MSKHLRSELELKAKEFKFEPDLTKKKGREMYRIAIKAMDKIDYLQKEIEAYKSPHLFVKDNVEKKVFLSKKEQVAAFIDRYGENSPETKRYLTWNKLSLEEAKKLLASPI